jgi:putative sterol carrier protein
MYNFLSQDWIKDYQNKWNANETLKNGLKKFSASMKYFVEGNEDISAQVIVADGVAIDSGIANKNEYDFEMWTTIDNWINIAKNELSPKVALLTKKLKFKGSMIVAMKHISHFETSLRLFGEVPTNWEL